MESMNRDRIYMENSILPYRGVRKAGTFYPWRTPNKLEPDLVHSHGGCDDMIRCFDNEFSNFQWWQVKFKIFLFDYSFINKQ